MFSVNIRAKSSCDILKSVGISRGIGIFFSPVRSQSNEGKKEVRSEGCTSCTSVQQAIIDCSDYIKMVQKPRKIKVFRGFLIPKWADIV